MNDSEPTPQEAAPETVEHAERSVLGAIMLSSGQALDLISLEPSCYRSRLHENIHHAAVSLRSQGTPADQLTIGEELLRQGVKFDPAYLHQLAASTVTPASIEHYARIVENDAARRRADQAGMVIRQMVADHADPQAIQETAQKALDGITPASEVDPVRFVAETLPDSIEELSRQPDYTPTPWPQLNDMIGGLMPGALYTIGARPGVGKALALDTPLPTPGGWTTMGEVKPGDYVIGMDGKPAKVTFATPVQYNRTCYEVEFSTGEVIVADAEHLWHTETRASRRAATPPGGYTFNRESPLSRDQRWKREEPGVKNTEEIRRTLRVGSDNRLNHSIPAPLPASFPTKRLPVDPYILGYWLGDGSSWHASVTVSNEDKLNLLDQVEKAGYHFSETDHGTQSTVRISTVPVKRGGPRNGDSLKKRLRGLGVIQNKHIPAQYLRSGVRQRRALLAGIMDSDGYAAKAGHVECSLTSKELAEGVAELARSLGFLVRVSAKRVNGRTEASSTCYTIRFSAESSPFRLPRKSARVKNAGDRARRRYITDIRPVRSVPVRCIQVDNDDHMYLAGEGMVPTHNTVLGVQLATALAEHGSVPLISLEMPTAEVHGRMISRAAHVPMNRIKNRALEDHDWERIRTVRPGLERLPIAILERSSVTIGDIRRFVLATSRRSAPIAGVIVDYLQLIKSLPDDRRARHEYIADLTRELKILAMDLRIPVVILSQLSRKSADRESKMPELTDLRESGAIEQDSDVVILLHRMPDDPDRMHEIDIRVAKNRHGRPGRITLDFYGHYSEVRDTSA